MRGLCIKWSYAPHLLGVGRPAVPKSLDLLLLHWQTWFSGFVIVHVSSKHGCTLDALLK